MRPAYGLDSWDNAEKVRRVCSNEELTIEGTDLIEQFELEFVLFDDVDVAEVWEDYVRNEVDLRVVRSVVSSTDWRGYYTLRMLCWMYEWYNRWAELAEVSSFRPTNADYLMFFTIRGYTDWLNLRQASFWECLRYMRHLELGRWKRGAVTL